MDEFTLTQYEIRIRGEIGETILVGFPGFDAMRRGGETVLAGALSDQAALFGVLAQIEALGLELLEVRRERNHRWPAPTTTEQSARHNATKERKMNDKMKQTTDHAKALTAEIVEKAKAQGAELVERSKVKGAELRDKADKQAADLRKKAQKEVAYLSVKAKKEAADVRKKAQKEAAYLSVKAKKEAADLRKKA